MNGRITMKTFTETFQKHCFWLALLLHLMLLMSFTVILVVEDKPEDKPNLYIPSYVAHDEDSPSLKQAPAPQKKPVEKSGLEKLTMENASEATHSQQLTSISISKETEPVHLVGDKDIDKPLLTLLGKALSAHLSYPKIAIDFNVQGVALIGFVLHPDGQVTDAQLVKSSRAEVLDQAALSATMAMSPVKQVNLYINEPKYMVVGVIFG